MLLAHQKYKDAHMRPFKEMLLDALSESGQEDLRGFEWYYLYSLCHRDSRTIASSLMIVEEALPSPDGTILAVRGHHGHHGASKNSFDSGMHDTCGFEGKTRGIAWNFSQLGALLRLLRPSHLRHNLWPPPCAALTTCDSFR
jgi:hypothetical protein